MGLFVMVGALVEVGVIGRLGEAVTDAVGDRYLLASSSLLWGSALLSGIVDNIPYVATVTPLVQDLVDAGDGAGRGERAVVGAGAGRGPRRERHRGRRQRQRRHHRHRRPQRSPDLVLAVHQVRFDRRGGHHRHQLGSTCGCATTPADPAGLAMPSGPSSTSPTPPTEDVIMTQPTAATRGSSSRGSWPETHASPTSCAKRPSAVRCCWPPPSPRWCGRTPPGRTTYQSLRDRRDRSGVPAPAPEPRAPGRPTDCWRSSSSSPASSSSASSSPETCATPPGPPSRSPPRSPASWCRRCSTRR